MRIVIKVGSNVLTRPDGMLDVTRLSAIVDQVADLRRRGHEVILVSSGAVASGRGELRHLPPGTRLDSVAARQLFSAVGQAKLINRYYEFFRDHSMHCGQVLATKDNFARRSHYLNQRHCMETMLANDVIPIVNENDTVSLTELMFTDNDELSGLIATMMDADKLVILSNIDGVFTGDPTEAGSVLLSRIEPGDDIDSYISPTKSSAGRGGMGSKCRISRRVASEGIEVVVANGRRDGIIAAAVNSDQAVPMTVFVPTADRSSRLKKWIALSDTFAKGRVYVNSGAAEALLAGGTSLLPVGVERVEGDFDTDDIVTVLDPDERVVAWGRATFGAEEARRAAGRSGEHPLIHADYIYINEL